METVEGAIWFGEEFFVLDAPSLIRNFKRKVLEEIIISECEFLVTLLIALIWRVRNETSRIPIARTDNLNVFRWLQNWKSKSGTVCRMLQASVGYLFEKQVAIIPRYVRSGRNFPCDHFPRTDEDGIQIWSQCNHMTRVTLPNDWVVFCDQWKPELDSGRDEVRDIRSVLQEHGKHLTCCEWRPS